MFVYKLSGCGFESRCSHLNVRYRVCFVQGVPDIQATTECRLTLKQVCDMIRAYSLLVILAIFLSTFTWINFMSTFFSTGTSLVVTESHTLHATWNRLIAIHVVDWQGQWHMILKWVVAHQSWFADASLAFCNLAKAFKHNTIYLAIKTATTVIHYCYCLVVSGKWRLIIWCRKINITSFIFPSKNV